MPELGHEPGIGQTSHRSQIADVDDDRIVGVAFAQVGDDAVVARGRVLHDAGCTVDGG